MSILPRLPSVRDIIKLYNLSAKAQLSQNFILDKNVTDKLLKQSKLDFTKSLVVEVGPGPGLLTRSIIEAGATNLVVVEKDDRFIPTLTVVQGDMLKVDPAKLWELSAIKKEEVDSVHIIGNLPFSVATPLLFQWLEMLHTKAGFLDRKATTMTLMFQKEVADRIIAPKSTPERSRISVMSQALCSNRLVYKVPSSAFVPKPKVDASVVQLSSMPHSPLTVPFKVLETIVRIYFLKRRKTIRRISKDYDPKLFEIVEQLGWNTDLRPEDITTEQFCQLANTLHNDHPDLELK